MKILIINPNSDIEMTNIIQKSAESYAKGRFDVVCKSIKEAPKFIETYEDQIKTAKGMIDLVRKHENEYDAFINACHCDPNIEVLKEITTKPVIGIGEASMKIASMLGHKFSVVSTEKHSIPNKEAVIRKYNLEDALASVRAPETEDNRSTKEKYLEAAKLAIEEDMAEVIVLGCGGMAGLDKEMEKELGVPVLDGVICALILAEGFVNHGISTSKKRRYNPNY